jgi:FKBP-type peptidyl-prolyl cis-trans isomerase SlyD
MDCLQGVNEVLAPVITRALEDKSAGDRIDVMIDCDELYGPSHESLVIIQRLKHVSEE